MQRWAEGTESHHVAYRQTLERASPECVDPTEPGGDGDE